MSRIFQCVKCLRKVTVRGRETAAYKKNFCRLKCDGIPFVRRNTLPKVLNRTQGRSILLNTSQQTQKDAQKALDLFYESREWKQLRYDVLKDHVSGWGHRCLLCLAENVQLHVDHIKPRSKFPALQLDRNNLQVLCRDCNLGKSNRFQDDWR